MRRVFVFCLALASAGSALAQYQPSNSKPPEPAREFRGAWVASVHNINWPSRPGLPVDQLKSELIGIFDLAAKVGLNAIILQVRPEGDALYRSEIEPWSYWLTGQMGKAPAGNFDPLEFACTEAHRRGLELHAWFNPFRARATNRTTASSDHMSKTHPSWMMPNGTQTWANPGLRAVQNRAIEVMVDVARRYDVDAIHIDDYFYPYPKKVGGKMVQQFDDSATFEAYRRAGGKIRDPQKWRIAEMNGFIERLRRSILAVGKSEVKFGVSPFGIWRPRHPLSIEADLDSVNHIAADSKHWLENGWVDYLSPQLYWRIDDKPHSFETLTKWWSKQNKQGRHLWPGTASDRIAKESARTAQEAAGQISITRQHGANQYGVGHIHWSFSAIKKNDEGLQKVLGSVYSTTAIPPATPWLQRAETGPQPAFVSAKVDGKNVVLNFKPSPQARWRLIQIREKSGGSWTTLRLIPGRSQNFTITGNPAEIAVRNVAKTGYLTEPTVLAR